LKPKTSRMHRRRQATGTEHSASMYGGLVIAVIMDRNDEVEE